MSAPTTTTEPAVWVACLACYNGGRLTGDWVAGTEAADYVACTVPAHEEWVVHDHEGYDGLLQGECSPAHAQALAELHARLVDEDIPVLAFVAWASNHHEGPLEADLDAFRDAYLGHYTDLQDWAYGWLEDTGMLDELPEWAQAHAQALANDWLSSNDTAVWTELAAEGGVHVFRQ